MANGAPRLPAFDYAGCCRVFLTVCTRARQRAFVHATWRDLVATQLLQWAEDFEIAVVVYSVMPDHVHVLAEGRSESACVPEWIRRWKMTSGYAWRSTGGGTALWQRGYFDHVLRSDESTLPVARYIVLNPVRAGLVQDACAYPGTGSSVYSLEEIVASTQNWNPPWKRGPA